MDSIVARVSLRLFIIIACAPTILGGLAGCETIGDDFTYFKEQLIPPSPGEAARWMFDQHDAEKRRKGTTLIANSPFGAGDVYVRGYRVLVEEEEHPIVKAAAVRALARHGDPDDAVLLAAQLLDPSQQVQWEAAKGMQRLHNPAVVGIILEALRNPSIDADVAAALTSALAQYPEDRVFQMLIDADVLDSPDLIVTNNAREALTTLTGEDFGTDSRAWLAWYREAEDPFAGQSPYYYPVYTRDKQFLEYIAFWSVKKWEISQQPAGLRPDTTQSTYNDGDVVEEG